MILIRRRIANDDRMIFSNWLRSWFCAFQLPETTNGRLALIETIKSRLANGTTLVVCPGDDENTILGWLCFHDRALDYAYTREASRREGICKALCAEAFGPMPFTCQNPTPRWKLIGPKLGCTTQEVT